MVRSLIGVAIVTGVMAMSAPGQAEPFSVEMNTKVAQGQRPKLKITAVESVAGAQLSLERDDGKKIGQKLGAMRPGAFQEIALPPDPGRHAWKGKIVTGGADKTEQLFDFESLVAAPLQILVDKAKVDLQARRVPFKLSREGGKVEVKVLGEGGRVIDEESHDISGKPGGAVLEATWSQGKPDDIVRIELRVTDAEGFFAGVALMPWSLRIPHEEVNFATDSAAIEDGERPKLEASLAKVTEALAKYKDLGKITLFIAGHTDTQGSDGHNLTLSMQRAQSIAGWFRKHGLRIPIAYEGFGEYALAVKTADNVDEPRNRRVDYILAVEEPVLRSTGHQASWKRMP